MLSSLHARFLTFLGHFVLSVAQLRHLEDSGRQISRDSGGGVVGTVGWEMSEPDSDIFGGGALSLFQLVLWPAALLISDTGWGNVARASADSRVRGCLLITPHSLNSPLSRS